LDFAQKDQLHMHTTHATHATHTTHTTHTRIHIYTHIHMQKSVLVLHFVEGLVEGVKKKGNPAHKNPLRAHIYVHIHGHTHTHTDTHTY